MKIWQSKMSKMLETEKASADRNRKNKLKSIFAEESKALALADKFRASSAELVDSVKEAFEMLRKIFSGEFQNYDWADLAWVLGGLGYLVMPLDAIPDPIPVIGLVDDAGALGVAFSKSRTLFVAFRKSMGMGKFGVLEQAIKNSGFCDSIRETIKRWFSEEIISVPPVGTPLLVSLAGVLEHSGIYLGGGEVAELYDDDTEGGCLRKAPLRDFLRQGKRIYAACKKDASDTFVPLSDSRVAECAVEFLNQPKVAYNIFRSNCHMFTASCCLGRKLNLKRDGKENFLNLLLKHGLSFAAMLTVGTFSVRTLMKEIGKKLNSGKEIYWCPVDRWNSECLPLPSQGEEDFA